MAHRAPAVAASIAGDSRLETLVSRARKPLLIVGLGARQAGGRRRDSRVCASAVACPRWSPTRPRASSPTLTRGSPASSRTARSSGRSSTQSDLLIGVGLDPVELLPRPWTFAQPIVCIGRWRVPDDHVPFAAQCVGGRAGRDGAARRARCATSEWDLDDVARVVREQRQRIDVPADGTGGLTAQRVVAVAAARAGGDAAA